MVASVAQKSVPVAAPFDHSDAVTCAGDVRRFFETGKPMLVAALLDRWFARKPGIAAEAVPLIKQDWADIFAFTKDHKQALKLAKQVWPYLPQATRTKLIDTWAAQPERQYFLVALSDSKVSSKADKLAIADDLLIIGDLRGDKTALVEALRKDSPAVDKLLTEFDNNEAFRKQIAPVSREDLVETLLGKNPQSVTDFFKQRANKGTGKDAIAGYLIVAAEAEAASKLKRKSEGAAARAEKNGFKAQARSLREAADAFDRTEKADTPSLAGFLKRGGQARL